MNKNLHFIAFRKISIRSIFLIFAIAFSIQTATASTLAEEKDNKITLNLQKVKIEDFLKAIEVQIDYKFLYRDDVIYE